MTDKTLCTKKSQWQRWRLRRTKFIVMACTAAACLLAGSAQAIESCGTITYDGKGAGQVVFNAAVHAAHKLKCADCHEGKGMSAALFEKERGGDDISMRKIELGRSCGACHVVSMSNTITCSLCHTK